MAGSNPPRLHPESWRELRQLVKLHGARAIIDAVRGIDQELAKAPDAAPSSEAPVRKQERGIADIGHIYSEDLEPAAALIIGRLFARYTHAPSIEKPEALCSLWWAVNALDSLAVAVSTATHFSIACGNHVRMVKEMVRTTLGFDPDSHHLWKYR